MSQTPMNFRSCLNNDMDSSSCSKIDSNILGFSNHEKDKIIKDLKYENVHMKTRLNHIENIVFKRYNKTLIEFEDTYAIQIENDTLRANIKTLDEQNETNNVALQNAKKVIKAMENQNKKLKAEHAALEKILQEVYDQKEDTEIDLPEILTEASKMKEEINDLKCTLYKLHMELNNRDSTISSLKLQINELKSQLDERKMNSEAPVSPESVPEFAINIIRGLMKKNKEFGEKLKKVENNQHEIKEENNSLKKDLEEARKDEKQLKEHEIKKVEQEEERSNLILQLAEKEEIIEELKNELKKRTYNLQELVNKELWDKNREIEKLNKLRERGKSDIDKRNGVYLSTAMRELQQSFIDDVECKENVFSVSDDVKLLKEQLCSCMEEKKCLLNRISKLEDRLKNDPECSLIKNLRLECERKNTEIETAEKSRQEASNACSLLTTRLEELADFLETLLTNDFGFISNKKKEILRQAIERSREISKSFSFFGSCNSTTNLTNIDLSVPILPDCSDWSFSGGENNEIEDINHTLRPFESDVDLRRNVSNNLVQKKQNTYSDFKSSDEYPTIASHDLTRGKSLPKSVTLVKYLNLDMANELVFTSGKGSVESIPETAGTIDSLPYDTDIINALPDIRGSTDDRCTADSIPEDRDFDSIPDTIDSIPDTVGSIPDTADSMLDDNILLSGNDNNHRHLPIHPRGEFITASSALVSIEDLNTGYESESEPWSEPDRNVSAARIGLQDSCHKVYRRSRPVPKPDTDSDSCKRKNDRTGKKTDNHRDRSFLFHNEHSKDESLRQHSKLENRGNCSHSDALYLRNCDLEKYNTHAKLVRDDLEQIFKYIRKTYKGDYDQNLMLKLKKISEEFEVTHICCSKLHNHLQEFTSRCELLSNILDETQNKFERVMIDLKSTRLTHNSLILEHEQKLNNLRELEIICNDLRNKLKREEDKNITAEMNLKQLNEQYQNLKKDLQVIDELKAEIKHKEQITVDLQEHVLLQERLKDTENEVIKLRSSIPSTDDLIVELSDCKMKVDRLIAEKDNILSDLLEYKNRYKESKNQIKSYEDRCSKLEDEVKLKDEINKMLSAENEEQKDVMQLVTKLNNEIKELNTVAEGDHIILTEKDHTISELRAHYEKKCDEFRAFKINIEEDNYIKQINMKQLEEEILNVREKLVNSEEKISILHESVNKYENEKFDYEKRINELQNTKIQYEKKMQELLSHIVQHRSDEESKLITQEQLLAQLADMKLKKNRWRKSMEEWKSMYEVILEEKKGIEQKLKSIQFQNYRTNVNDYHFTTDSIVNERRQSADFDKSYKVHHLEKVKMELENRVRELEVANKELESHLHELQIARIPCSDCEATSGDDSSRPCSPLKRKSNQLSASPVPSSPSSGYQISPCTFAAPFSRIPNDIQCSRSLLQQWLTPIGSDNGKCEALRNSSSPVSESEDNMDRNMGEVKPLTATAATSPDLGIGSDHGRRFSFEENNNTEAEQQEVIKLEEENITLKRQLDSTRKALKETLQKLTMLNRNKKQMEKAICKQIYKTNNILKKARVNLEEEKTDVIQAEA